MLTLNQAFEKEIIKPAVNIKIGWKQTKVAHMKARYRNGNITLRKMKEFVFACGYVQIENGEFLKRT